ncbi:MAG: cytochrome c oxidase subunit II [Candidatus Acidiferrales bacterium]
MPSASPFNPASGLAQPIAHLFLVLGIVMMAIFLLVTVLVLYASFRYRQRPGAVEPRQEFGSKGLEVAWTIAPLILLVYIFTITVHAMRGADPGISTDRQPDMVIVGHQWWWEARYMASHIVAANEIHIPVGKLLLVRLESADVIHDWWVPQLGRKMDAIPGHPNLFWLEADVPGTYLGTCSEYCGAEHAWMRILVVAQPEVDFLQWTKRQLDVPPAPSADNDAALGAQLFLQQLTCANCHAITGTSAKGTIGPDLTHFAGRQTLAAGRLENSPANLSEWLSNPQAVKPGVHMPNFELTSGQVGQLTAYLETLK